MGYSPDGTSFEYKKKVFSFFNVSCGIRLKDGIIALYGEDFAQSPGRVIKDSSTGHKISDLGMIISEDGEHFKKGEIFIKELTKNIQGADSAIVQLPDGNYRLYFVENTDKEMFSATSDNGYDFTFEGKVDDIHMADPEIMYEQKSKKFYLFGRVDGTVGKLKVFESKDGKHFSAPQEIISPFNVQFSIIDMDGKYLAYGTPFYQTGIGGIPNTTNFDFRYPIVATSDNGLNWIWSGKAITGPWKGDTTLIGSSAVIKEVDTEGLFFYWTEK